MLLFCLTQRKKVSEEFTVNPTDHLTKLGILDISKSKGRFSLSLSLSP